MLADTVVVLAEVLAIEEETRVTVVSVIENIVTLRNSDGEWLSGQAATLSVEQIALKELSKVNGKSRQVRVIDIVCLIENGVTDGTSRSALSTTWSIVSRSIGAWGDDTIVDEGLVIVSNTVGDDSQVRTGVGWGITTINWTEWSGAVVLLRVRQVHGGGCVRWIVRGWGGLVWVVCQAVVAVGTLARDHVARDGAADDTASSTTVGWSSENLAGLNLRTSLGSAGDGAGAIGNPVAENTCSRSRAGNSNVASLCLDKNRAGSSVTRRCLEDLQSGLLDAAAASGSAGRPVRP